MSFDVVAALAQPDFESYRGKAADLSVVVQASVDTQAEPEGD